MADNNELNLHKVKVDGLYGFADKDNNIVIPCQWKFADSFFEGTALVEDQSGNRFIIDKSGNIIEEYKMGNVGSFQDGRAWVVDENGKYGFINKKGTVVIPCEWSEAESFKNGVTQVKDESGEWYIIDKRGKVTSLTDLNSTKLHVIERHRKDAKFGDCYDMECGFADEAGNIIIPYSWAHVEDFCEGLARVRDYRGKCGFIWRICLAWISSMNICRRRSSWTPTGQAVPPRTTIMSDGEASIKCRLIGRSFAIIRCTRMGIW